MKIIFPKLFTPIGFILAIIAVSTSTVTAQPTNFSKSAADLRTQLDSHINQPRFSGALWGIKIASLATGKTIYENHADRLMSPASNSKLYAAALALETFGGDYQFGTPVLANGTIGRNGTLHGDLIVSGRGDPSWKATNFWDNFTPFIAVLTNADIRRITGDLVMDTTFFHGTPYGASWCVEDLEDSEGAEVSALTLEDNTAQIVAKPGAKKSDVCSLELSSPDTGIILVNRTKTIAGDGKNRLEIMKPPGGKNSLRVWRITNWCQGRNSGRARTTTCGMVRRIVKNRSGATRNYH